MLKNAIRSIYMVRLSGVFCIRLVTQSGEYVHCKPMQRSPMRSTRLPTLSLLLKGHKYIFHFSLGTITRNSCTANRDEQIEDEMRISRGSGSDGRAVVSDMAHGRGTEHRAGYLLW